MTDTMSSITAYLAQVQSTMSSIPDELNSAGDSGDFSSVLATINSLFSPPLAPTTAAPSTATVTGASVVSSASSYLGVPYVWGGTSPAGFDCSGLVQYVYGKAGVSLPWTADEQSQVGTPVDSVADAQPGDLVFFAGSDGTASAPGHVGIYIGNGQMIDAPQTGEKVRIEPVGDPVAIRRVLAPTQPTTDASSLGATAVGSSGSPTPVPAALAPMFLQAAAQYKVPVQLLTAVARTESGFDPNAVSSAGAQGLMQLMPQTAAGLGVNPLDPQQAIDGAAQLLSSYLGEYHSTPLALAAYNAGPAAVAQYGGVPPYAQTQAYVSSIMSQLGSTSTTQEVA